jgi:hypothetical protein
MQIDPQITFEGLETSAATRGAILNEIARLEVHSNRITGCRVTVIAPSHKHRHGPGFEVHISLTIPPHEDILVNRTTPDDARHEHVEVAIKDAFSAARRQLDSRLCGRG